ncbi:hypothetical protein TruAng_001367 [Truncatella angustata]|nr:hypothetical protein TruAng_001367 [Truncatella angustata]
MVIVGKKQSCTRGGGRGTHTSFVSERLDSTATAQLTCIQGTDRAAERPSGTSQVPMDLGKLRTHQAILLRSELTFKMPPTSHAPVGLARSFTWLWFPLLTADSYELRWAYSQSLQRRCVPVTGTFFVSREPCRFHPLS